MFTIYHFIWLAICAVFIVFMLRYLLRAKPELETVLTWACIIAAVSEFIKVFANIGIVPSADGSAMHMFMEWRHLPFHLCSIQILFIFYVRFAESAKRRETILAFMYPTCVAGALAALLLPSIFTNGIEPYQAFTHPIAYQFFFYHSMLIILGVYIGYSGKVNVRWEHLYSTLGIMFALGLISIYLNSAFAYPTYEGTTLLTVENTPNFFFTFRTPIGIPLTALWQWLVYIGILSVLLVVIITLFYLPFRKKRGEQPK